MVFAKSYLPFLPFTETKASNRTNSITQYNIAITIRLNEIKSNGKLLTVSKCLHVIFILVRQLICKMQYNNDDYTYQDTVATTLIWLSNITTPYIRMQDSDWLIAVIFFSNSDLVL
jgi:hypothetical protein